MTKSRSSHRALDTLAIASGLFVALGVFAMGCRTAVPDAPPTDRGATITIDRSLSHAEIDPSIYSDLDDPNDPFASVYEGFRARRARDMNDPDKPPPIEAFPPAHPLEGRPWDDVEVRLPFDWSALRKGTPVAVDGFARAIRARLVLDHPDVKITQLMLGPGATLPGHAGGAPGFYHVLDGEAEITVEGRTQHVTPGTTVKLDPYDVRRVHVTSTGPLRMLWIRWAPDGDQRYVQAGYYLTGANMHVQPREADMPPDYQFWGEDRDTTPVATPRSPIAKTAEASFYAAQTDALERARSALGEERNPYPETPRFAHESDVPWVTEEMLANSGFFWAKDIASLGDLARRWSEVFRLKGFFRAKRPDGGWDFNISMMGWGSRAFYVEHSHSIPEFYYMISGPVHHWVDGTRYTAMPGDVYVTNSYTPHQSRGIVDDMPFRSIGASWPPNGRREVFSRPFFVVEPLPEQPGSASLGEAARFHP